MGLLSKKNREFDVYYINADEPHTQMTYKEYLSSQEWQDRRYYFIDRLELLNNSTCVKCGGHRDLHIHHKHYRTLGNERPEDVEVLCQDCHKSKHRGWL